MKQTNKLPEYQTRQKEIILDDWQKEILKNETDHILLTKGRRIGATHLFAIKAVEWLITHYNPHPSSQIVCSSITEDQAQLLIAFATNYAATKYKHFLGKGADKPTLNRLILKVNRNRRILLAKPVGNTGAASRGFEGQVLMVDEGAFQPEAFWIAAKPILATTGGRIWTWSTFNGRGGYFWKSYEDAIIKKIPNARFKIWTKTTEDVFYNRPLSAVWTKEQREEAIKFLEEEKKDMSEISYAQEYLAIASLEKRQFYSDEWIKKVCHLKQEEVKNFIIADGENFGGFDIARMGGDQFTAEILKRLFSYSNNNSKKIVQIDHYTKKMLLTTDNENLIIEYSRKWNTDKSGIDAGAGSLGVSVLDHLQLIPDMKNRIVPMNNRSLSIKSNDKTQRLFNEDMHDNLRALGERGEIHLFDDEEIKTSFRSVQWDLVTDNHGLTRVKISSRFGHIVEGIMRAAELANQKSLNLSISYI